MSDYPFSKRSVWGQRNDYGEKDQVFIFYHSTKTPEMATGILRHGFKRSPSRGNMLGEGIYVAKDLVKALPYGPVTFKLLVYTGRIIRIDHQGHRRQKTWQSNFNSAWVPPHCGMVRSGLQENCIRDPEQIRILGVVRGYDLLSPRAQSRTTDLTLL